MRNLLLFFRSPVHKFNGRYGVQSIIGPDHSVVSRSQQYLYDTQGHRPVHFKSHFLVPYWIMGWVIHFAFLVFLALTKYHVFCMILAKVSVEFKYHQMTPGLCAL